MNYKFSDPKWNDIFTELQRKQIFNIFINTLTRQNKLNELETILKPFEEIPFEDVKVILLNPPKEIPEIKNCLKFKIEPKGFGDMIDFKELWKTILQEFAKIGCIVWLTQTSTKAYIHSIIGEDDTLTYLLNPQIDISTNIDWYATMNHYLKQFGRNETD